MVSRERLMRFCTAWRITIFWLQPSKRQNYHKNPNLLAHKETTIIRCDRNSSEGGGLAFIIKNTAKYKTTSLPPPPNTDKTIEQQCISIYSGKSELNLVNIYIPPASSCPSGYRPSINHILGLDDCIIMGDFNGHHSLWYSLKDPDQRGEDFANVITSSSMGVLNEDTPTRVTSDCI